MSRSNLRINLDRLLQRIDDLAQVGAIDGGGVCRLALSDADRAGRDKVVGWMKGEPGAWGFLAGQAVDTVRVHAGRSLADMERRLVWSRMWWWLEQVRTRIDGPV